MRNKVFVLEAKNLREDLKKILDTLLLKEKLKEMKKIVLKPNLTTNLPYPITTDSFFVEILVENLLRIFDKEIIIAEGSGGCDTKEAFEKLGYTKIAQKYNLKLIDLNRAERIKLKNKKALKLKEIFLPKILFDSFLISLPVPKDHSSAVFTCSLKNMIGVYLSREYVKEYDKEKLEKLGVFVPKEIWQKGWNKGELHEIGLAQSIFDLNLYRKPDLTICDARYGVRGGELGGKTFKIGKIVASFDPVASDTYLASLFGYRWEEIEYLKLANKKVGFAQDFQIEEF